MYLIAGLGNPGKKYEETRHNIGFKILDAFADRHSVSISKQEQNGLTGLYRIDGSKVLLVKPQTYMNDSGACIRGLMDYYDIPIENLLVIYDDIDLEVGVVRTRKKGGSGTHNGMRSIIAHTKNQNFPRVRVGVDTPEYGELISHVLGKFSPDEKEKINASVNRGVEIIESFIRNGIDRTMNLYNGRPVTEE
jgi:PTH1 family peptidyl-tRNA hydrolase